MRERTRKRGLAQVLRNAPEVQRFLATQAPKPPKRRARDVARELGRRYWPAFFGLVLAFSMALAAFFKHWGT
jgi:hypothetical protein